MNNRKAAIGAAALAAALAAAALLWRAEPASDVAFAHAKALYAIASGRHEDRLVALERSLDRASDEQALSAAEELSLRDAIASCRQGSWEAARRAAWGILERGGVRSR